MDAILDYAARPVRFDPTRGVPLERFLQLAAARNLADMLKAETRRRHREAAYFEQQRSALLAPQVSAEGDETEFRLSILSRVDEGPERTAFALWLSGERRTAALAAALALSHLSPLEQSREVKRFKDRARQRRQRIFRLLLKRDRVK